MLDEEYAPSRCNWFRELGRTQKMLGLVKQARRMKDPSDINMYSSEEVADILKCVPTTIEAAWRAKRLPGIRIGQHWMVPASALQEGLHLLAMANMAPEAVAVSQAQLQVATSKATKRRLEGPPALPPLPPILQRGANLQKPR